MTEQEWKVRYNDFSRPLRSHAGKELPLNHKFTWNGDTVTVTDQNGTEITEELSGQEIYDGIYSSEEISFSLSFL